MILCDTNILIEFYKGNSEIIGELHKAGLSNLAVSVVTIGELFYGARDKAELIKIQKHLALMKQIQLDEYALSHRLSVPDALIAATALSQDIPVFTLNLRDFRYISDLKLYKP
jgi:tRNA(fMet)-specific endonuclease VapC